MVRVFYALAAAMVHVAGTHGQQIVLGAGALDPGEVRYHLKVSGIIPTVLDDFEGTHALKVKWSSDTEAEVGNTLDPNDLQHAPAIKLSWAQEDAACEPNSRPIQYTIAATDPDAPSRNDPKWSEICHWIATGIAIPDVDKSSCGRLSFKILKDVIPYKPPGPPEKTGKHRYVFVAYAPANGTTERLHLSKPGDRQHWGYEKKDHGVRDWARENGLEPVAANFIYAQNKKQ